MVVVVTVMLVKTVLNDIQQKSNVPHFLKYVYNSYALFLFLVTASTRPSSADKDLHSANTSSYVCTANVTVKHSLQLSCCHKYDTTTIRGGYEFAATCYNTLRGIKKILCPSLVLQSCRTCGHKIVGPHSCVVLVS